MYILGQSRHLDYRHSIQCRHRFVLCSWGRIRSEARHRYTRSLRLTVIEIHGRQFVQLCVLVPSAPLGNTVYDEVASNLL